MKLTIEIGRDDELRKEILKLVKREISNISMDEIRKMTEDYLQNVNVAAKVTSTIKDLLNKQVDYLTKGYGEMVVKQQMDKRMDEWLEKNFKNYFEEKCKPFIRDYLDSKAESFGAFVKLVNNVRGK